MKKITTLFLLMALASTLALSQTRLGYLREAAVSLPFTSYKPSSTSKLSGVNLDLRVNYSIIGTLAFRNNKKFMIGDHIGAGFGIGYWKKVPDDIPMMAALTLQFGAKAAYYINDDIEVGVKYMHYAGDYFTDLKNDFGLTQQPGIIPSVRVKNFMGTVGFGSTKLNKINTGKFFMAEGRYLLSTESDDKNFFLFFRVENYSAKSLDYTLKGNQIFFGVGIM
jgi:hypothetical protein